MSAAAHADAVCCVPSTVNSAERLRAIKPDVIMVSSCLMGQTGPLARYAGYGNLAAAISDVRSRAAGISVRVV